MGYNIVELIEFIFEGASFFYVIFVQTSVLCFVFIQLQLIENTGAAVFLLD